MPNRLNRLRNRSTGCGRPVEYWSREVKNLLFLLVAFFSRSRCFPYRLRIISCNNLSVKAFKRVESLRGCVRAHWSRNPSVRRLEAWLKLQVSGIFTWLGGSRHIVNGLEALGKTYKESEKVMKILRSLPSKWHTKVTAIQEAKDLTKLPMEELIGSLMTYEINLTKKLQEGEDKKKKSIALKATTKEEEDVEEEKPSDEDDD
ncbi:hypothetical protein CK203_062086 [Vitis vinifera]|uniref:UBN2 domain-containing protein n=1 Tax=Vitis vinifera TaxID=29760 RepID=A0A438GMX6_VITVI|nr:hypothetical protein CK203_062086 [Vitis vinifera]